MAGVWQAGGAARAARAADPAPETKPNPAVIPCRWIPLTGPVRFDVFYAILPHSNGKVYVGTCYHTARLLEIDPAGGTVREVAAMTSQAGREGRATSQPALLGDDSPEWTGGQEKIHTQLFEGPDGRVYGGTHTHLEDANGTRGYPGGHWFAFDPRTRKVEDLGVARRNEGIIACCYDRKADTLYGVTWPTGYLVACRLGAANRPRRLSVLDMASGKIDCSTRYLEVLGNGRVYVPDGATGAIRVYDPAARRLVCPTGMMTPSDPSASEGRLGSGTLRDTPDYRNWWISGARSPDGMHLFLTSQRGGRLTEIDATAGDWGRVIDHGRLVPWAQPDWAGPNCGVMAFGRDGLLYHSVGAQMLTYDPASGRVADLGRCVRADDRNQEVYPTPGGLIGPDGKIYAIASLDARRRRSLGLVIVDPAAIPPAQGRLLRVAPTVVRYPTSQPDGPAGAP